jgi:hypothetical protein
LLGVAPDERLDECGFAYAWGTDDADDDWGRFFGEAVDKRDVEALFFDLRTLVSKVPIML